MCFTEAYARLMPEDYMEEYHQIISLSTQLEDAVSKRDAIEMARLYRELYSTSDMLDKGDISYASIIAYFKAIEARLKYLSYNNFYELFHSESKDAAELAKFIYTNIDDFSKEEISEIRSIEKSIHLLSSSVPSRHMNKHIHRCDTFCTLCRIRPANKTGSHMVPNFLSHPTFSFDGKGTRGREALDHDCLNTLSSDSYYGPEVPEWRFAMGQGKESVSDEDIENNVNQLEFDNEFCSVCESRFSVLESAYAQYYKGQKRTVNPRISYLFWLSVLWRMSMGSISVFLDMEDELELRTILNNNIGVSQKEIEQSDSDLGNWKYAIFRAEGLRDGDKGIFGSRQERSPYVAMYNDLVMVFFHNTPREQELTLGPICVDKSFLNDWHQDEVEKTISRRSFWDVRDWIVESSEEFFDPVREKVLLDIREQERTNGSLLPKAQKEKLISQSRLENQPKPKFNRLRKYHRMYIAWKKTIEAKSNGEEYDPLKDEDIFLQERDFRMYYEDLARLAKEGSMPMEKLAQMPFYDEARKAIPDEEWIASADDEQFSDTAYLKALDSFINQSTPSQLRAFLGEDINLPARNPFKNIGRNDPCPCGSGLKYKNCHGK